LGANPSKYDHHPLKEKMWGGTGTGELKGTPTREKEGPGPHNRGSDGRNRVGLNPLLKGGKGDARPHIQTIAAGDCGATPQRGSRRDEEGRAPLLKTIHISRLRQVGEWQGERKHSDLKNLDPQSVDNGW